MSYGFHFPVSFDQTFNHGLTDSSVIVDVAQILKDVTSNANVSGNTGISNAKADAIGLNTIAETVNTSWSIQNQGSGAYGSSVSAGDAGVNNCWCEVL